MSTGDRRNAYIPGSTLYHAWRTLCTFLGYLSIASVFRRNISKYYSTTSSRANRQLLAAATRKTFLQIP